MKIKEITHSTQKGTREYQEDRYFVAYHNCGVLLAVFDGHGGDEASTYCYGHFSQVFIEAMEEMREPTRALKSSFGIMASVLRQYYSGTTASLVFIPEIGDKAYTAVVGDSPIVVGRTDSSKWFGPDHNVRTNSKEAEAAQRRGGFLSSGYIFKTMHGQGLQMARSLGDYSLTPVVSTEPEINTVGLMPGDYILVATDGLFDPGHRGLVAASKAVTDQIEAGYTAQQLVEHAVVHAPTHDNVTAILARF